MESQTIACNSELVIHAQDVTKSFKDVLAVDGINLQIRRGEYVALLGPNGAGKTTLVEMIEGIQKPDQGRISLLERTWKSDEMVLRKKIGLALQETRFIDKLTAEETLQLFASFYRLDSARIPEILDIVNLTDKRRSYVVNLSGGQRQKLALGVAIINSPEILILDEPTMGLDPNARREIWNLLNQLKKQCTTLILTTHYMEEAEFLCERIIIMHQGRFLAQGTLKDLLAEHAEGEIIEFALKEPAATADFSTVPGVRESSWDPIRQRGSLFVQEVTVSLPPFLERLKQSQLSLSDLVCRKMTLDDLFSSLTGRSLDE